MKYSSTVCEQEAILRTAQQMCAAARTAPKTKGTDHIRTLVLTGDDKDALAATLESLAEPLNKAFFVRDANNLRAGGAVVLIGTTTAVHGLDAACQFCGFAGCSACTEAGAICAYDHIDLGIAVGSAVSVAADLRVDSRVMYSIGRAAMELKLLGEDVVSVLGIPLSVSGKSPFFDRK